jgi:hypothetical protein
VQLRKFFDNVQNFEVVCKRDGAWSRSPQVVLILLAHDSPPASAPHSTPPRFSKASKFADIHLHLANFKVLGAGPAESKKNARP